MRSFPAPRGVLALAGICLAGLLPPAWSGAEAGGQGSAAPAPVHDFALPAQPLGDSLDAFSRVTGAAVLIDQRDAAQPVGALAGAYTAAQALDLLLADTGLSVLRTQDDAYVVIPGQRPPRHAPRQAGDIPGVRQGRTDFSAYVGHLQAVVVRSLCGGGPLLQAGDYRVALQMRVAPDGRVPAWRLLDTTGSAARDAALGRALDSLYPGPPPAGLPQPVSMLILPDAPGRAAECAALARRAGRAP